MAVGRGGGERRAIDRRSPKSERGDRRSTTRPDRRVVHEEDTNDRTDPRQAAARHWRIAVVAAACPPTVAQPSAAALGAGSAARERAGRRRRECGRGGSYHIGYSNGGGVGNGFREEQVCTAKAEALASGQVSKLTSSTATRTPPASSRTSAT